MDSRNLKPSHGAPAEVQELLEYVKENSFDSPYAINYVSWMSPERISGAYESIRDRCPDAAPGTLGDIIEVWH